jgi:hypothetical protein
MEDAGRLLPKLLRGYCSRQRERLPEVLAPFWGRLAGKTIAENSRPISFRHGNLTIAASTDCWATQLRSMAGEIRDHINAFFGEALVARVSVRYSATFSCFALPQNDSTPAMRDPHSIKGVRPLLDSGAAALDPAIRSVVETSFVKYFSRHSNGAC